MSAATFYRLVYRDGRSFDFENEAKLREHIKTLQPPPGERGRLALRDRVWRGDWFRNQGQRSFVLWRGGYVLAQAYQIKPNFKRGAV